MCAAIFFKYVRHQKRLQVNSVTRAHHAIVLTECSAATGFSAKITRFTKKLTRFEKITGFK